MRGEASVKMTKLIALLAATSLLLQSTIAAGSPPAAVNPAVLIPDKSHEWNKRDLIPEADSNDSHEWGRKRSASNDLHKRIETFKVIEVRIEGPPAEPAIKHRGLWKPSNEAAPGAKMQRDVKYSSKNKRDSTEGEMDLRVDKRGMIEAWMHPRSLGRRQCQTSGYEVCYDQLRCCPQADFCCPGSPYCKSLSDDVCCGALGTCDAGFTCHSLCECVPSSAQCCSNGRYCEAGYKCCSLGGCAEAGGECCSNGKACSAGNICVISGRTGEYGCCTDLSCTAYVDGGTTVTRPSPPPVTLPPDPVETGTDDEDGNGQVVWETYYLTIRWYYYSYYWYFFAATSTITSTEVSTTTVVSVSETDRAAASSSLDALSESVVEAMTTPEEATTARAAETAEESDPFPSAPTFEDLPPLPTFSPPPLPTFSGPSVVGGGGEAGAGFVDVPRVLVWCAALGAGAVGVGMVWL